MNDLALLLNIACGHSLPAGEDGRGRRLRMVASGFMAALVFAALWGLAAGSHSATLALANVYKVPMVIVLSAVSAVPAGLLAWKLIGAKGDWTDILIGFTSGIFTGTLVLAVLAPLVALYYHSSGFAGPILGSGTVFLALGTGAVVFLRTVLRGLDAGGRRVALAIPVLVFLAMQLASMLQLVALASPIFPERTVFSGGIDQATTLIAPETERMESRQ